MRARFPTLGHQPALRCFQMYAIRTENPTISGAWKVVEFDALFLQEDDRLPPAQAGPVPTRGKGQSAETHAGEQAAPALPTRLAAIRLQEFFHHHLH